MELAFNKQQAKENGSKIEERGIVLQPPEHIHSQFRMLPAHIISFRKRNVSRAGKNDDCKGGRANSNGKERVAQFGDVFVVIHDVCTEGYKMIDSLDDGRAIGRI